MEIRGSASRLLLIASVAAAVFVSHTAFAIDKRVCVDSADLGQKLRSSGQWIRAREQFVACADATCPAVVRTACADWVEEVDKIVPSIVIGLAKSSCALDPQIDPANVRVWIDDTLRAQRLDGTAIAIDPGEHTLRLESPGALPFEEKIFAREGEKSKLISTAIESGACKAVGESPKAAAVVRRPSPRLGAWVTGAVSVISFGTFGYFAGTGNADYHDLKNTCAPHCNDGTHDDEVRATNTKFVIADVALGVGIAAAAVSLLLFLLPHKPATPVAKLTRFTFDF